MKIEDMADFLEEMNELLLVRYTHYILNEYRNVTEEDSKAVEKFVQYCINSNWMAKHDKRGKLKKSYVDYKREKEVLNVPA